MKNRFFIPEKGVFSVPEMHREGCIGGAQVCRCVTRISRCVAPVVNECLLHDGRVSAARRTVSAVWRTRVCCTTDECLLHEDECVLHDGRVSTCNAAPTVQPRSPNCWDELGAHDVPHRPKQYGERGFIVGAAW